MNAKIEKGFLVVRIPVNKEPVASSSGKMLIVASSGGWKPTTLTTDEGHEVKINLTAGIKNPDYAPEVTAG